MKETVNKEYIEKSSSIMSFKNYICIAVAGFIGVLLSYLTPVINQYIIDNYILNFNKGKININIFIVIIILVMALTNIYVVYFVKFLWKKWSIIISNRLKEKLAIKLMSMAKADYSKWNKSKLFNLIYNDCPSAGSMMINYKALIILSILRIISCVTILFVINIELSLISILFIPLYFFITQINGSKLKKLLDADRNSLDKYTSILNTMVSHKIDINNFNSEKFFLKWHSNELRDLTNVRNKYYFNLIFIEQIPYFISAIAPLIILIIGSQYVWDESITVGVLIMFAQYLNMLFEPLSGLSEIITERGSMKPIFDRINNFLNFNTNSDKLYSEIIDSKDAVIEIKNCDVYVKEDSKLFHIDDFTMKNKGIYSIKGENGSGKTTFFNLLTGINSIENIKANDEHGYIRLSNILKNKFSYLYNPPLIFEGTVKENIVIDLKSYDSKLLEYLKDILNLKDLDYKVKINPTNLSLGEQKKIFLARVLLRNTDLILLDEPTVLCKHKIHKNAS